MRHCSKKIYRGNRRAFYCKSCGKVLFHLFKEPKDLGMMKEAYAVSFDRNVQKLFSVGHYIIHSVVCKCGHKSYFSVDIRKEIEK